MRPVCGKITASVNGFITANRKTEKRLNYRAMLEDVVKRIHTRLKATGLSASGASLKAGLSRDAIRNLERAVKSRKNAGASTATIAALAKALGTSTTWLMDGVGPEEARDSIDEKLKLLRPDEAELLHEQFDRTIDLYIERNERKHQ